ncbi:hypothetical protein ABZ471_41485 [Streptomyces sp. NPDC005728]|uniref:hypothetical protein n=1 Tax=Streptomyces sp. NPDC005728 TaxID=3157054 RepID=UPI0033F2CAD8
MALNATALITTAAATEYQHYVKVREEVRHPAPSTSSSAGDPDSGQPAAAGTMGLATTLGEASETAGAGVIAVASVLAPVLSGAAAMTSLIVGLLLRLLGLAPSFARMLLTMAWVFGAIAAAATVAAAVALLVTALRNSPYDAGPYDDLGDEVARAREAWREALLERGILPFLQEALGDPGTTALRHTAPSAPISRMPRLGHDRPGFRSPDSGTSAPRPSFTTPDFASPDFGGPAENTPSTGSEHPE